jgi:hypothetical protein
MNLVRDFSSETCCDGLVDSGKGVITTVLKNDCFHLFRSVIRTVLSVENAPHVIVQLLEG